MHLSKSEYSKFYWCDGICIDQHNSTVRAQQVKNMLRIFEKAETVVAWMGNVEVHHLEYLAFVKRDMSQETSAFESVKRQMQSCRVCDSCSDLAARPPSTYMQTVVWSNVDPNKRFLHPRTLCFTLRTSRWSSTSITRGSGNGFSVTQ